MIRHLVFVNYTGATTAEVKRGIIADLANLRTALDGITDFGHAPNISPEAPVIHGFEDMFWFDFRDAAARDAYLEDAAHKAIGARIVAAATGGIAGIFVCDIELPDTA